MKDYDWTQTSREGTERDNGKIPFFIGFVHQESSTIGYETPPQCSWWILFCLAVHIYSELFPLWKCWCTHVLRLLFKALILYTKLLLSHCWLPPTRDTGLLDLGLCNSAIQKNFILVCLGAPGLVVSGVFIVWKIFKEAERIYILWDTGRSCAWIQRDWYKLWRSCI